VNSHNAKVDSFDYRSPKTINTDSSFKQHQIIHSIDQWRNLSFMEGDSSIFHEDTLLVGHHVGFYRVFQDKPLSSYYVQAGSCKELSLQYEYNEDSNSFEVIVGPLYDDFLNPVSDGTLVIFNYSDGVMFYTKEVQLKGGYAKTEIKYAPNQIISLYAQINETKSQLIELIH